MLDSGDYLLVGAPGVLSTRGQIYLFSYNSAPFNFKWALIQTIDSGINIGIDESRLGTSVAMGGSANGGLVAIAGAPEDILQPINYSAQILGGVSYLWQNITTSLSVVKLS